MGWNYRIMRHVEGDETTYAVHEVYYDNAGCVLRWTTDPAGVISDERGGLLLVLAKMADAYGLPVLDGKDGKVVELEEVITDTFAATLKRIKDEFADDPPLLRRALGERSGGADA